MKLLQIYNGLAHYRESIYTLIDQEYDSDYLLVNAKGDIKQFDPTVFRGNVTRVESRTWHGLIFQQGLGKAIRGPYDVYLALGETHNVNLWLFAIGLRLLHPKKRLYFWSHGWYGKESGVERMLKKVFFRLPNGGTFLYGNYARELMIKEGFNPDKLFVIHNSLAYYKQVATRNKLTPGDVYADHFGNAQKNLLFVGRLTRVKHLDMILDAMVKLKDRGKVYNLTMIGAGEVAEALKALTHEMGLDAQVWFFGPCYDEDQLGTFIYNADLTVSPGNVGLTAIHSMVFGTPVITHNDFPWQMPEFEAIKEGKTGGFFERDNVDSLANSIEAWFERPDYDRETIRKACFDEIDNYWTPQYQLSVLKEHLK